MTEPAAMVEPPVPIADEQSAGFWEAAGRGRLAVQRCRDCGVLRYPPGLVCTSCFADPPWFEWFETSGRGTLATWTVVHDAFLPGFAAITPYVVAEMAIDEDPAVRVVGRLVGIEPAGLRVGLPLAVEFVEVGDAAVATFAPAPEVKP